MLQRSLSKGTSLFSVALLYIHFKNYQKFSYKLYSTTACPFTDLGQRICFATYNEFLSSICYFVARRTNIRWWKFVWWTFQRIPKRISDYLHWVIWALNIPTFKLLFQLLLHVQQNLVDMIIFCLQREMKSIGETITTRESKNLTTKHYYANYTSSGMFVKLAFRFFFAFTTYTTRICGDGSQGCDYYGTSLYNINILSNKQLREYSNLSDKSYYLDLTPKFSHLIHDEMCSSHRGELTIRSWGVK